MLAGGQVSPARRGQDRDQGGALGSASWKTRMAALGMVVGGGGDRGGLQLHQLVDDDDDRRAATASIGQPDGARQRLQRPHRHHRHQRPGRQRLHPGHRRPVQGGRWSGTEAYADYVNSTGGVNGRKIMVDSADDGYTGTGNKQATQNAVTTDFALVGGFSTFDSFGGTVLAQNPGDARRDRVLDPATNKLPNVYSAGAARGRMGGGPAPVLQAEVRPAPLQHVGHAGRRPALARGRLGRGEVRHGEGRLQGRLRPDRTATPRPTSPRTSSP